MSDESRSQDTAGFLLFLCPNGHKLRVPSETAGRKVRCPFPNCGTIVRAPDAPVNLPRAPESVEITSEPATNIPAQAVFLPGSVPTGEKTDPQQTASPQLPVLPAPTVEEQSASPAAYRRVTWWELAGAMAFGLAILAFLTMAAAAFGAFRTEQNLQKMQGPGEIHVDAPGLDGLVTKFNQDQRTFYEKAKGDMQNYAARKWAAASTGLLYFVGFGLAGTVLSFTGSRRYWGSVVEQPFTELSWPARFTTVFSNLVQLAGVLLLIGNVIGCLAVSSPPSSQKAPVDEMRRRFAMEDRIGHGGAATSSMILALYGWSLHRWVRRREGNLAKRWDRATLIIVCALLVIVPSGLLLALWIWYT